MEGMLDKPCNAQLEVLGSLWNPVVAGCSLSEPVSL